MNFVNLQDASLNFVNLQNRFEVVPWTTQICMSYLLALLGKMKFTLSKYIKTKRLNFANLKNRFKGVCGTTFFAFLYNVFDMF